MLGCNTKIVNVCILEWKPVSGINNDAQLTSKRSIIYSRSSVEMGNRDPFDSVSAQFMVFAEFIGSQIGQS